MYRWQTGEVATLRLYAFDSALRIFRIYKSVNTAASPSGSLDQTTWGNRVIADANNTAWRAVYVSEYMGTRTQAQFVNGDHWKCWNLPGSWRDYQAFPVSIGGASLEATAPDTASVADVATVERIIARSSADAVSLADAAAVQRIMDRAAADPVSAADVAAALAEFEAAAAEPISAADTAAVQAEFTAAAADPVTSGEAALAEAEFEAAAADPASVADASDVIDSIAYYPDQDASAGGWTADDDLATGLYEHVDDWVNQADWIKSGDEPSSDPVELDFPPLGDLGLDEGITVELEMERGGPDAADLSVQLYAGATLIRTENYSSVAVTKTRVRFELTAAETTSFRSNGGFADASVKLTADKP